MTNDTPTPTDDQLADAVAKAKDIDGLSSSEIKMTDRGAGMVRHYLSLMDSRFATYPLDSIRLRTQNLSRAGQEPGHKRRSEQEKRTSILTRLRRLLQNAFPRAVEHSQEYADLHESEQYKRHRDALKREYGYRCQGCSLCFHGDELQGHIVDYRRWNEPGMMLILCVDCHELVDSLRRRGVQIGKTEPELPLIVG
jgi:5-methylcytosine-specific restriction endonuclease McrA